MSRLFRRTDNYKTRLKRIGAALKKFSAASNATNSLADEAMALEELSLSTYSLMKAINKEIEAAANCNGANGLIELGATKEKANIIIPGGYYDMFGDQD